MEEEKENIESSVSIWHRDLNLLFVYGVIFLAGIAIVFVMINILNSKVEEINNSLYTTQPYNNVQN